MVFNNMTGETDFRLAESCLLDDPKPLRLNSKALNGLTLMTAEDVVYSMLTKKLSI